MVIWHDYVLFIGRIKTIKLLCYLQVVAEVK